MSLELLLKEAIKQAIGEVIATEVQEIVVKETRRELLKHERNLTVLVRAAVQSAIAELLG